MTFSDYGIDISKIHGNAGKMVCPKCSKDRKKKNDPCLSVDKAQGLFKCHNPGCGFQGRVKNSTSVVKNYTKPQWTNVTELSDGVVKWFSDRGISQDTLIKCKISEGPEYMPQVQKERNTIQFPYIVDDEVVNVKYRDGQKNFKLFKGAELVFFNLDSIKDSESVIITEGEIDAMSFIEAGYPHAVSIPNGASTGNKNLEYLDNCIDKFDHVKKIYIATDDDEPGRSLRDELARRLGVERCYKVMFNGFKDANELLKNNKLALEDCISDASPFPIEGVWTADNIVEDIWDLHKNGLQPGVGTTMDKFNELLTFVEGYFTMATGVPNHGKSEFVDQIIVDLNILHGWKAAFFSPENYPLQLHFSKIASRIIGKHFDKLNQSEMEAIISHFDKNFFWVVPEVDVTVDSVLDKFAACVKKYGIKMCVIDAWNRLDHQYDNGESETKYISRMLSKIDTFCKRYGVHMIIVAHPTKLKQNPDGKYPVPTLYDISGSAHFYNYTANGISVYRNFQEDGTSTTTVRVQKVKFKHWGSQGEVQFKYDVESGRYHQGIPDRTNYLVQKPGKVQQTEMKMQPSNEFDVEIVDSDIPF